MIDDVPWGIKRAAPMPGGGSPAGPPVGDLGSTVDHPAHYNAHPAGIECVDVVEHLSFNVGNAIKYLWRLGHKGDPIEQLEKSLWYIRREIARLEGRR